MAFYSFYNKLQFWQKIYIWFVKSHSQVMKLGWLLTKTPCCAYSTWCVNKQQVTGLHSVPFKLKVAKSLKHKFILMIVICSPNDEYLRSLH